MDLSSVQRHSGRIGVSAMTDFRLVAARDAASTLAAVFGTERTCTIQVLEDQCFAETTPMSIGKIRLRENPEDLNAATAMVAKGGFEWHVPGQVEIQTALEATLGIVLPTNPNESQLMTMP